MVSSSFPLLVRMKIKQGHYKAQQPHQSIMNASVGCLRWVVSGLRHNTNVSVLVIIIIGLTRTIWNVSISENGIFQSNHSYDVPYIANLVQQFLAWDLNKTSITSGHCFRQISTTLLADAGADILRIKCHGLYTVAESIDT